MLQRGFAVITEVRRLLMSGAVADVPAVDVLVANIDGDVYEGVSC